MQARRRLIEAIAKARRGEISKADLDAAADEYIAEIKRHGKATGRKLPLPGRAHIIRALG